MRLPYLLAAALVSAAAVPAAAAGHHHGSPRHADDVVFQVGTAVEDITPKTPQYLGGFGQMATPTAVDHDPLQVRAFAVAQPDHGKLVEFAIVDSQGYFSGYQEGPYG